MDQSFLEFKKKWLNTLQVERRATTLLFHTKDQIINATVKNEDTIVDVQKGSMLDLQDTYGIGLPIMVGLGPVNPSNLVPIFALLELQQLNLIPFLQDVPEDCPRGAVEPQNQLSSGTGMVSQT